MASKTLDPLSVEEPPTGGGEEERRGGGEEERRGGGEEERTEEEERGTGAEWNRLTKVPVKVLRGHSEAVTTAQLCFNDRLLLSCSSDHSAILWDVDSCSPLRVFDGVHSETVTECAVIPNSNRMVTVSWDKTMASSDLETGQTLWRWRRAGLLTSCSCSGDGRLLVCAADPQNAVYIIEASSGQTLHAVCDHHRSTITRCRFHPQSQSVATVSADRSIKLWDLLSQRTAASVDSNHGNVVSDCCFSDSGHFLCSASWDKSLKLWDLQAGGLRPHGGTALQSGHEGSVSSCCFSTDANLLASASYDRTVALWDTSSLCQTLVLKGHSDWVTDVSVSADRKLVASASKDATVRLWNVDDMEDRQEVTKKKRTEGTGTHILEVFSWIKIW
uniref:WD repeat-containing protein 88 n=1 Tax=Dicentrarchus labrax TaxID=13489 RepID=A0A8P4K7Y7_DICLA